MGRWKRCSAELMNEKNEGENREEELSDQEVAEITEGEVRRILKSMESGKVLMLNTLWVYESGYDVKHLWAAVCFAQRKSIRVLKMQ